MNSFLPDWNALYKNILSFGLFWFCSVDESQNFEHEEYDILENNKSYFIYNTEVKWDKQKQQQKSKICYTKFLKKRFATAFLKTGHIILDVYSRKSDKWEKSHFCCSLDILARM